MTWSVLFTAPAEQSTKRLSLLLLVIMYAFLQGASVGRIVEFLFGFDGSIFFHNTVGIGIGIGLAKIYKENSLTTLMVSGFLNAAAAGILNYMAFFIAYHHKAQRGLKLLVVTTLWSYVLLGAGSMFILALWA
ncbi:unnamed protein product [Microthlaspi erraticum]|uniref:Uncharacterized protein n=1 Tax=Microthlaspi erraticum TaxID=1685480 RepID=A0A6D2J1Z7_9BRAS|nr:unnamed protein product [Microthlaspi erraticum]